MGIYHNEWPPTLVPENDFPVLGPIMSGGQSHLLYKDKIQKLD